MEFEQIDRTTTVADKSPVYCTQHPSRHFSIDGIHILRRWQLPDWSELAFRREKIEHVLNARGHRFSVLALLAMRAFASSPLATGLYRYWRLSIGNNTNVFEWPWRPVAYCKPFWMTFSYMFVVAVNISTDCMLAQILCGSWASCFSFEQINRFISILACMIDYPRMRCVLGHVTTLSFNKPFHYSHCPTAVVSRFSLQRVELAKLRVGVFCQGHRKILVTQLITSQLSTFICVFSSSLCCSNLVL